MKRKIKNIQQKTKKNKIKELSNDIETESISLSEIRKVFLPVGDSVQIGRKLSIDCRGSI